MSMINVENIHSLSDFQRNTKAHVERLKKTGEAEVLTVNGKAELVVISAEAFVNSEISGILQAVKKIDTIKKIETSLENNLIFDILILRMFLNYIDIIINLK